MPRKSALFLLLGFCLFTPVLLAYAPHPTVLTVQYKDQMLPVTKVRGSNPCVLVDGREKLVLADNPLYLLQDATGFGDGFVASSPTSLEKLGGPVTFAGLGFDMGTPASSSRSWTSTFFTELISKKSLKGGFAVVVIYSSESFTDPASPGSRPIIIVRALPELPAGKKVEVDFTGQGTTRMRGPIYFIQIFDETGREIMTNDIAWAWAYYTLRDVARLSLAMPKYLAKFKGADHDAVPAIMPKPIFQSGAVLPKGEVPAILTIAATGQVSEVEVQGMEDAEARKCLTEALGGWLFLPRLKAGQPVATKISVPLQF